MENDFFLRVFDIVRLIPKGKVTTYGMIAQSLGAKRGARMVGWAMNVSHQHDPNIPAHRVVNRKGLLTGKMHFDSPDAMQSKLEQEGIRIEKNQILHLEDCLWDPASLADEL